MSAKRERKNELRKNIKENNCRDNKSSLIKGLERRCVCVCVNLFLLSFSNRDFRFCKSNEKEPLHKRQLSKREGERGNYEERERERQR